MTHEEMEDTKIILEFMGYVVKDFKSHNLRYNHKESASDMYYDWLLVERCEYHLSYNELMPVWHKFRNLKFQSLSNEVMHFELCDTCANAITYKPIEYAFRQLSDACKWVKSIKK